MTALAAIVLKDAANADVSFAPSAIDPNGVAHLFAAATAVMDDRRHISMGVKLPKTGGAVARVTAKVVIPLMDPNDSSLKIGEGIANIELVLPKRADATMRNDLLAFSKNFLDDASVEAAVASFESIY